jgi:hypothetical protein
MKYRVEIFLKNNWCKLSYHKNLIYAAANADSYSKSRKCNARIIYNGKIVYEVKYKK